MNRKTEELIEKMEKDFEKAYKHVMRQTDKTNREYWILTEWKASIDKYKA